MTGRPTTDGEREHALTAIIAAYNEVTERLKDAYDRLQREVRRLREELEHKNEELRRRERLAALGEMAAGLAHEVRNPLGGIALQATMLEQELGDRPAAVTMSRRIRDGVRMLDRLVSDVLGFAQEGVLELAPAPPAAIVERVVAVVESTAAQRGTRLVIESQPTENILCDADRLQRALINLVQNAIQACDDGGRVTIFTDVAVDGCGVVFRVTDDGPGIAVENLERIFNPFFTTKPDGTGLGLSIVHRIVEAHGGRIRATSAPGRGATFELYLPAARRSEA